jgi:uncharacterized membrane protein YvbJ
MTDTFVACAQCGETQSSGNVRCAKCGASMETDEQRRVRLARLEQTRREGERNDVSIHRLPGFGTNGTSRSFGEMSHQLRRRYIIAASLAVLAFVFIIVH